MAKASKSLKSVNSVDLRVIDNTTDRKVALADPRMPDRIDTISPKDWTLTRPKDLPGMNGKKIKQMEQLKAYISKIPPAPRDA